MRRLGIVDGDQESAEADYRGTLEGVGKVYVQVVVDVFCSLAFAKVYTSKMPVTSADLLYDRVLPFYDALGREGEGRAHRQWPGVLRAAR
jgi:hypothetical protein